MGTSLGYVIEIATNASDVEREGCIRRISYSMICPCTGRFHDSSQISLTLEHVPVQSRPSGFELNHRQPRRRCFGIAMKLRGEFDV